MACDEPTKEDVLDDFARHCQLRWRDALQFRDKVLIAEFLDWLVTDGQMMLKHASKIPVPPPKDLTCNNERKMAGLAYPRTCAQCGLGPCAYARMLD